MRNGFKAALLIALSFSLIAATKSNVAPIAENEKIMLCEGKIFEQEEIDLKRQKNRLRYDEAAYRFYAQGLNDSIEALRESFTGLIRVIPRSRKTIQAQLKVIQSKAPELITTENAIVLIETIDNYVDLSLLQDEDLSLRIHNLIAEMFVVERMLDIERDRTQRRLDHMTGGKWNAIFSGGEEYYIALQNVVREQESVAKRYKEIFEKLLKEIQKRSVN